MKRTSAVFLPLLSLGLTTALAVQACGTGSQSHATQEKASGAEGLKAELRLKFPDWKIAQLSDLPPDDRKLWIEAHPHEEPGLASGNFRNKSEVSYAVLLIPRVSTQNGFRLVLAVPQDSGTFALVTLEKWDKPEPTLVISRVPPGKYWDAERGETVQVAIDSILLETPEAGGTLYHWNGRQFRKVVVSQ